MAREKEKRGGREKVLIKINYIKQNKQNKEKKHTKKEIMLSKNLAKFFSTTAASTKPYVWINKDTKVICQGITGN